MVVSLESLVVPAPGVRVGTVAADSFVSLVDEFWHTGARAVMVSAGKTAAPFFERLLERQRADPAVAARLRSLLWLLVDDFEPGRVPRHQRFEHELSTAFFGPAGIAANRVYSPSVHGEHYPTYVREAEGILVSVLASNPFGETAGNDVGSTLEDAVRPVAISPYSRRKYARRFGDLPVPAALVSTGLLFVMHHSHAILAMFEGRSKMGPLAALVEGRVTDDCPVTHLASYPVVRDVRPGRDARLIVVTDHRNQERLARRLASSGYAG